MTRHVAPVATWLGVLGLLGSAAPARAADWPMLQGTEPVAATEEGPRPFGFVQALGEGIVGGAPVEGLTSESLVGYDGERASFNRLSGTATWGMSMRRVRAGVRGVAPRTGRRVNWLVAAELGDNGMTRMDPVVLTDASVTLSVVPHLRVRAGQFKLPIGEEALESNPNAAEFVNVSTATSQLLAETPIQDGAYVAGGSGYRDVGVQAFDTLVLGRGALAWAVMLSNGRMGTLETDDSKDLTGRLAWSPWVGDASEPAHREELTVFAFWQQGGRTVDDVDVTRVRRGAGVELERRGWHVRVEGIDASGAIEVGPTFPGAPASVRPEGRALGGYGFVHYEHAGVGAGLRYDALRRNYDAPSDLRVYQTATADVQYAFSPRARLMLDYELRFLDAPEGSAEARAIAATMGDRVSAQANVVF